MFHLHKRHEYWEARLRSNELNVLLENESYDKIINICVVLFGDRTSTLHEVVRAKPSFPQSCAFIKWCSP
jgi:hypothetical protein